MNTKSPGLHTCLSLYWTNLPDLHFTLHNLEEGQGEGGGGSKYRLICKLWRPFTSIWMSQFFERIPILLLPVWFSSTKLLKRMGYPFSSRELLQKWVQVCSCLRLACKHASANFNLLHNLAPSFATFTQLTWIITTCLWQWQQLWDQEMQCNACAKNVLDNLKSKTGFRPPTKTT